MSPLTRVASLCRNERKKVGTLKMPVAGEIQGMITTTTILPRRRRSGMRWGVVTLWRPTRLRCQFYVMRKGQFASGKTRKNPFSRSKRLPNKLRHSREPSILWFLSEFGPRTNTRWRGKTTGGSVCAPLCPHAMLTKCVSFVMPLRL